MLIKAVISLEELLHAVMQHRDLCVLIRSNNNKGVIPLLPTVPQGMVVLRVAHPKPTFLWTAPNLTSGLLLYSSRKPAGPLLGTEVLWGGGGGWKSLFLQILPTLTLLRPLSLSLDTARVLGAGEVLGVGHVRNRALE